MSRPLSDITNGRQSRALKRDRDFVAILLMTIDQKSEGSRGSAQVPSGPRLRHDPYIGTRCFPTLWVSRLCLLIGNRASDDNLFALFPIDRRSNLVLGCKLQRVEATQH